MKTMKSNKKKKIDKKDRIKNTNILASLALIINETKTDKVC